MLDSIKRGFLENASHEIVGNIFGVWTPSLEGLGSDARRRGPGEPGPVLHDADVPGPADPSDPPRWPTPAALAAVPPNAEVGDQRT